jgi:hypothetical protein
MCVLISNAILVAFASTRYEHDKSCNYAECWLEEPLSSESQFLHIVREAGRIEWLHPTLQLKLQLVGN